MATDPGGSSSFASLVASIRAVRFPYPHIPGVHTADNTGAADSHVSFLMGNQYGGADGVIAAACGVCAVNTDYYGNA